MRYRYFLKFGLNLFSISYEEYLRFLDDSSYVVKSYSNDSCTDYIVFPNIPGYEED